MERSLKDKENRFKIVDKSERIEPEVGNEAMCSTAGYGVVETNGFNDFNGFCKL